MAERIIVTVIFNLIDEMSEKLKKISASLRQVSGSFMRFAAFPLPDVVTRFTNMLQGARKFSAAFIQELRARYGPTLKNLQTRFDNLNKKAIVYASTMEHLGDTIRRINWQFTYMLLSLLGVAFNFGIMGHTILNWTKKLLQPIRDFSSTLQEAALASALMGVSLDKKKIDAMVTAWLRLRTASGLIKKAFIDLAPHLERIAEGFVKIAEKIGEIAEREDVQRFFEELTRGFEEFATRISGVLDAIDLGKLEDFAAKIVTVSRCFAGLLEVMSRFTPEPVRGVLMELANTIRSAKPSFEGLGQVLPALAAGFMAIGLFAQFAMMPMNMITVSLAALSAGITVVSLGLKGLAGLFRSVSVIAGLLSGSISTSAISFSALAPAIATVAMLLGGLVAYLYLTNESFRNSVKAVLRYLREALNPLITAFKSLFSSIKNFASALVSALRQALEPAVPLFKAIFQAINAGLQTLEATFASFIMAISTLLDLLAAIFRGDFDKIDDILRQHFEQWKQMFTGVIEKWKEALRLFKEFIVGIIDDIIELFQTLADKLIGIAEKIKEKLAGIGEGIKSKITGVFEPLTSKIAGAFDALRTRVTGSFEGLSQDIVGSSIWTDMLREMLGQSISYTREIQRVFNTLGMTPAGITFPTATAPAVTMTPVEHTYNISVSINVERIESETDLEEMARQVARLIADKVHEVR